jgi:Uma2 family endonuclease
MNTPIEAGHDVAPSSATPQQHKFTVKEYYRLAEAGIFHEDSRVELIQGEIIDMPPIGSQHAGWVDRLAQLFFRLTRGETLVRVQNPLRLDEHSEPQPDLALLRPRELPYTEAHPSPQDVLLLIEVADSSARYEHERKIPLYARHGVAEVWLFDLTSRQLEIYLEPSEDGYRKLLRQGCSMLLNAPCSAGCGRS